MTDTQNREALLPCPFCGSTDIDPEGVSSFKDQYKYCGYSWNDDDKEGKIEHRPACNNCSATTDGDWNHRAPVTNASEDVREIDPLSENYKAGYMSCFRTYGFQYRHEEFDKLEAEIAALKQRQPEVTVDQHVLDRAIRCLRTAVWRAEDGEQGYQMHPENLSAAKEVIAEYEGRIVPDNAREGE